MGELFNDGGPAFPSSPTEDQNGNFLRPAGFGLEGMTLLDHFAGLAMQALLRQDDVCTDWVYDLVAEAAYQTAEAMLKQKEKLSCPKEPT